MSPTINPMFHPLAQLNMLTPISESLQAPIGSHFVCNPGDPSCDGSGGGNQSQTGGNFPTPGTDTTQPNAGYSTAGNATSDTQTISTSILSYIFTSRFVIFLLGLICLIAGLYLLKPGPVTTIVQAPFKAAKGVIKAGAEAAPIAA